MQRRLPSRWPPSVAPRAGQAGAQPAAARPSGLGLDSDAARARMVEQLRERGIGNDAIHGAMRRIPRHAFVDPGLAAQAYDDIALPIGHGQTISKASSVARLLQVAGVGERPAAQMRVLDIGSGCGYQAAVLALLAREVFSVERIKALHDRARLNVRGLRLFNLHLLHLDANALPPSFGRFDAIISAASASDVPTSWFDHLADGGVLVSPVGDDEQQLLRVDRAFGGALRRTVIEGVRFVPLKSGRA
jgi:protein-L-isoaspartate(D-aspartate) O-methyltransferase